MKINLLTFSSSLSQRDSIVEDHHELLNRIAEKYELNYVFPEDLGSSLPAGPTMVFVESGGVEEHVAAFADKLPPYILLIADGLKNSLAASLEIMSWMHNEGKDGRVLHGDMDYMMHGIDEYVKGHEALTRLQGKRVGVIGKPSGWLIASGVDYESIKQSWGVELVDVPLQEVVTGYENIGNEEVKEKVEDFRSKASGMIEPTEEDLFKAMRLYESVKAVCTNHHLDAFTLNCFDLIPTTKTTGCLALALLNQEGIPAGCEGDIQTILTMLAVKVSTDEPCFMANPSKILDNKRHEMILAHCTIAPSMTYKFYIRSHFESSIGVAIQGVLHHCDMTILKCGGKDMSRYFISKASLLECTDNRNMCRTQMRMILEEPVDYFLKRSIGNHHVIVKGDHKDSLEWMMKMLGAKNILATK